MRISNAFPSDYLKAADLDGRQVTVVMSHVEMKDIGGDHKPILFFQGKEKGMVLNKTNAGNISALYGDDTDDWAGKPITLFEAMVDFQGKTVAAIRVRAPRNTDRPANRAASSQTHIGGNGNQYDERNPPPNDDIPF